MDIEDIKSSIIFIFWVLILLMIIFAPIMGIMVFTEWKFCKEMMPLNPDFDFNWTFWTGCRVQTPIGYWVNAHEYQYLEGDINSK